MTHDKIATQHDSHTTRQPHNKQHLLISPAQNMIPLKILHKQSDISQKERKKKINSDRKRKGIKANRVPINNSLQQKKYERKITSDIREDTEEWTTST